MTQLRYHQVFDIHCDIKNDTGIMSGKEKETFRAAQGGAEPYWRRKRKV